MTLGLGYGYVVNLSTEEKEQIDRQVGENLHQAYEYGKINSLTFVKGIGFGLVVGPSVAFAKDELAQAARHNTQVEVTRRATNAVACGAILAVCKGKAAEKAVEKGAELGAGVVGGNPSTIAAFACGACVAWCLKYAIFDK